MDRNNESASYVFHPALYILFGHRQRGIAIRSTTKLLKIDYLNYPAIYSIESILTA